MAIHHRYHRYIRTCIQAAQNARDKGNHPFAALLAIGDKIIASAENTVSAEGDPTRHAELNLVSQAARDFPPEILAKATLYASTEPCPMCCGAIYWCGIRKVVYCVSVETLLQITSGIAISCRDIFAKGADTVEVIGPVLEREGRIVHEGFW